MPLRIVSCRINCPPFPQHTHTHILLIVQIADYKCNFRMHSMGIYQMPTELFAISTSYYLNRINSLLFFKVFSFRMVFRIEWNCICGFSQDKIVHCTMYLLKVFYWTEMVLLSHLYNFLEVSNVRTANCKLQQFYVPVGCSKIWFVYPKSKQNG